MNPTLFLPTYLYIKQHSITKKYYFGKTTCLDPIKYTGSGKHWKRHIKVHGTEFVETLWYCLFTEKEELVKFSLMVSNQWGIVEDANWLNIIPENGLDGGKPKGCIVSSKTRTKMSEARMGNKNSLGFKHSMETKNRLSKSRIGNRNALGFKHSEETCVRRRVKQEILICPTCLAKGGRSNMTRYHFNNCKER